MQARLALALLGNRRVAGWIAVVALSVLLLPVFVAAGVTGVIAQTAEATCSGEAVEAVNEPAGGGPIARGLYAAPLELQAGRWYEVGATEYGGPGDPSSGKYGSIPEPGQSYLPAHPDTFAELSVLQHNPAAGGEFTFADANALDRLPYLTGLRVAYDGRQMLLYKRDIGYGQGRVR